MGNYEEYYRERCRARYSGYNQRQLKQELKKVVQTLEYINGKISELKKRSKKWQSVTGAGITQRHLYEFKKERLESEIEREVLNEMIKPKVINWKACAAMCLIGFVLYNGVKAEMKSPDKENETTTSMHGTEEANLTSNKNRNSLGNIFKELGEAWEEHQENYEPFVNPTESIR